MVLVNFLLLLLFVVRITCTRRMDQFDGFLCRVCAVVGRTLARKRIIDAADWVMMASA